MATQASNPEAKAATEDTGSDGAGQAVETLSAADAGVQTTPRAAPPPVALRQEASQSPGSGSSTPATGTSSPSSEDSSLVTRLDAEGGEGDGDGHEEEHREREASEPAAPAQGGDAARAVSGDRAAGVLSRRVQNILQYDLDDKLSPARGRGFGDAAEGPGPRVLRARMQPANNAAGALHRAPQQRPNQQRRSDAIQRAGPHVHHGPIVERTSDAENENVDENGFDFAVPGAWEPVPMLAATWG